MNDATRLFKERNAILLSAMPHLCSLLEYQRAKGVDVNSLFAVVDASDGSGGMVTLLPRSMFGEFCQAIGASNPMKEFKDRPGRFWVALAIRGETAFVRTILPGDLS